MKTLPLKISDETLRDGEQQAGVFFSYETKRTLSHLIAKIGVDSINIMPSICQTEESLIETLVSEGLKDRIISTTMLSQQQIDQAKASGINRIFLFHALSDRLLFLRNRQIRELPEFQGKTVDDNIPQAIIDTLRQEMIAKVLENLRYATSEEVGLKVVFAAEDATRADFDFLVHCICSFRPYVEHFMLCDSVGVLSSEKSYVWIHNLRQSTNEAPLGVH